VRRDGRALGLRVVEEAIEANDIVAVLQVRLQTFVVRPDPWYRFRAPNPLKRRNVGLTFGALRVETSVSDMIVHRIDALQPEPGGERRRDRNILVERFSLALDDSDHCLG